ncbi:MULTISPECIES: rhomboid family intramembrane serine protease [Polaribacter]|uniref:Rhomboid family intramembrane serine protease n=1 Tax=Polaribacter sejongensis TaxID=985043 RepID=A0AAJ1VG16_9FLAO|nr:MULTISPECIES: rhomboid family intramembrane serine protease [Polaribacter]AUC22940.1 rhomboid family intramembrane serine protease [Polaribacter sejongensis]MDN3618779.1 rhomboid family intramembrane serine protease [Polaribacter undariae]UWD32870.1 rhomboid family intramembrane serine protease [Polaribacter undariae]
MSFIDDIKNRYKSGNIVEKLIYINLAIFVFTLLTSVFQDLYKGEINWVVTWFSLDDNFTSLLTKPWTIITYGFLHADFLHILLNLITLYFVGNLFIEYFTQKQLLTFYLLGTFFGGALFILSHNYFPLFQDQSSILVGASAGISAIFIGITTYIPNYQLKIRFIGFVKLWYLGAIWVGLDILALSGGNAGGHFAHLGGALFGFLYVQKAANKEILIFDKIAALFSTKKKPLKTVYKSPKKTVKTNKGTSINQQQIDAILDKISKSGYDTLTKEEKEFLFKQGR